MFIQNKMTKKSKNNKKRFTPKGRQPVSGADKEISDILPKTPLRRDLLIEYLHIIHDHYGCLYYRHLFALAQKMSLSQAEIYEVASFYHHFDIVKDDVTQSIPITIRVCDSLSCMMAGAQQILQQADSLVQNTPFKIVAAPCMGNCAKAPAASIGRKTYNEVSVESLKTLMHSHATHTDFKQPVVLDYENFEHYRKRQGYTILQDLKANRQDATTIMAILSESGLAGLGGAGFPTARKWQFVRAEEGPRYMCVNADEGEPGTFKDRYYLESKPHQFLEGMLIAATCVEAERVFIYLRDEYPEAHYILRQEIQVLEEQGIIDKGYVDLRRGAGAYICGEESALIESIEGKRGLPRHRPPYVAQKGVFNKPTLVHNVETVYWIPEIIQKGAQWFVNQGKEGHKGVRSFSVSGRVCQPGVKIAPAGISVRELIEDYCGGMQQGHVFKAYLPGGASGGILPATLADIPLDFGTLQQYGCLIGSHAIVILSEQDNIAKVALNLMSFFQYESCGQCTPCRCGTEKAVGLMQKDVWDADILNELSRTMADASICGLGQAAPNPLLCAMKYFPQDCGLINAD